MNNQNDDFIELETGTNIILYGVPGVGKSHEIKSRYCRNSIYMERVVFHPEYTFSDFVGQILPKVENDQLEYVFTPGPFTNILKKAVDDPNHMYFLIIEEINRGNAPAIFGDIFQLLDRKSAPRFPETEIGESEYGITNYDIAKIVYKDETEIVRLPKNLSILATMNTADQSVFTLDTAFQRRWKMKQIPNKVYLAEHAKDIIENTKITWEAFVEVTNQIILQNNDNMSWSEDKRLGAYFIKKNALSQKRFPEKVLKYLWDDVFKTDHTGYFSEHINNLDDLFLVYANASESLRMVLNGDVYEKMANYYD